MLYATDIVADVKRLVFNRVRTWSRLAAAPREMNARSSTTERRRRGAGRRGEYHFIDPRIRIQQVLATHLEVDGQLLALQQQQQQEPNKKETVSIAAVVRVVAQRR